MPVAVRGSLVSPDDEIRDVTCILDGEEERRYVADRESYTRAGRPKSGTYSGVVDGVRQVVDVILWAQAT